MEARYAYDLTVIRKHKGSTSLHYNSPALPSPNFSTYSKGYTLTTVTETLLTFPPPGKMEVKDICNGPGYLWKPNLVSQRVRRVELLYSFSLTSPPI